MHRSRTGGVPILRSLTKRARSVAVYKKMTPKQLNPWLVEPLWQNFSSLYREAITAQDAKTGMERSHHLTASLYFGIAALEAFLNKQMRDRLKAHNSEEEEILNILRKQSVLTKIKKWPQEILGRPMPLREETL